MPIKNYENEIIFMLNNLGTKGNISGEMIGLVFGVIIGGIMITVFYATNSAIFTTEAYGNETVTMASTPAAVSLTNRDIVSGSMAVYNATNSTITVNPVATAGDCGSEQSNDCFYNYTTGDKITYGTVYMNQSGDYYVSYSYYPPSYSHSSVDRTLFPLIATLIIIALIVAVARYLGYV